MKKDLDQDKALNPDLDQDKALNLDLDQYKALDSGSAVFRIRFIDHPKTQSNSQTKTKT